jgi:hypothetical protein
MNDHDVAKWMLGRVNEGTYLYQEVVVYQVLEKFGEKFTYINENGNLAISKKVLAEFKKLSGNTVIWERGSRAWRLRTKHDSPGRQQEG